MFRFRFNQRTRTNYMCVHKKKVVGMYVVPTSRQVVSYGATCIDPPYNPVSKFSFEGRLGDEEGRSVVIVGCRVGVSRIQGPGFLGIPPFYSYSTIQHPTSNNQPTGRQQFDIQDK